MVASGDWYVAEAGEVTGPLTAAELAVLAATRTGPILVWADGLDGWSDAREVEALGPILELGAPAIATGSVPLHKPSVAERAKHELIEYLVIAGYLYVCFFALILYKAAILRGEGIPFSFIGFAAAKALILGKFLLLLQAVKVGERRAGRGRMLLDIGRKALLFALLLIVLSFVEEIGVGWFHGKSAGAVVAEMTGNSALQVLATALLMVLVLIPYFAFHSLTERLGEGVLARMLIAREEGATRSHGHARTRPQAAG